MLFSETKRAAINAKRKRHEAAKPKIYTAKYIDQNELFRLYKYITNSNISSTFWTVHVSVSPPAVCSALPTILFYGFRIPFTFMRRIESVRDKSLSKEGGGWQGVCCAKQKVPEEWM